MFFHICGIMIGVKVGVFISVLSLRMPEYVLGDRGAGDTIELGGCRVPEEVCMQVFGDGEAICGRSKHVLQGPGRDSLSTFGQEKRSTGSPHLFEVFIQKDGDCLGQNKDPLTQALFLYPYKA
jgi:hypothetical protein